MRLVFDKHGALREFHAVAPDREAKATVADLEALDVEAAEPLALAMRRAVARGRVASDGTGLTVDGAPLVLPEAPKALTYAEALALVEKGNLAQLRPLLRLLVEELLRQGAIDL